MNKFIKRLSCFTLSLLGVFLCLEFPVQLNYEIQTWDMSDWNQLDGINAEILLVGNSRSWTTFDCTRIEQNLGKSCYVLAQDGWQANMLWAKLRNYLSCNEPPETLIFQVDQSFLATRKTWYAKGQFLKFLWLDRENLYSTTKEVAGHHSYEFIIPFVRYSGYPGVYIRDAFGIPHELKRSKGFAAHPFKHYQIGPLPESSFDCKSLETDWIKKLAALSPESRKIGIWPLVTQKMNNALLNVETIENACNNEKVQFLNLNSLHPLPDSIFKDNEHVNELGAKLSTDFLINELNKKTFSSSH